MASDRYTTIAAMLDDPINRLIVERELVRRSSLKKWAPTPSAVAGGGWVFLTAREWQRRPNPCLLPGEVELADSIAQVFESTEGWFLILIDGTEVGPFDNPTTARDEGIKILTEEGWVFFDPPPWDHADAADYPIK